MDTITEDTSDRCKMDGNTGHTCNRGQMDGNTGHTCNRGPKERRSLLRIYLMLALSMMLFKAAEAMYRTTINNYLYHWIYEKGRETNYSALVSAENTSVLPHICYPNMTIKRDEDLAHERADKHQTKLLLVASTLSLLSLMLYGCLSDYYGRKIIFIACISGYIIQICTACVILNFYCHINYLYFAYIADGIGGSAFGFSLGCFLSLADIARTKKEKVLGIALIDSLVGIGSITTKYSTTLYLQRTNYNYPMFTACGFCILLLFLTIILLDDTLSISRNTNPCPTNRLTEKRPRVKNLIRNLTGFYTGSMGRKTQAFFWLCFFAFCLAESPSVFRSDLLPLIQLGWPFCWNTSMINMYTFCALGATYAVGMMLVKPLQHCFSDTTIGSIGLLSAMAFNFFTAEARTTDMLYIGVCSGILMLVPKPVIRGLASKVAGAEKQGALFAGFLASGLICEVVSDAIYIFQGALFAGFLASELICEVVSDVIYIFCYAHHSGPVNGQIFLVLGAGLKPCLLIILVLRVRFRVTIDGEIPELGTLSINYNTLTRRSQNSGQCQ